MFRRSVDRQFRDSTEKATSRNRWQCEKQVPADDSVTEPSLTVRPGRSQLHYFPNLSPREPLRDLAEVALADAFALETAEA